MRFPREKREQGRVEAVEPAQQKADPFLSYFSFSTKKEKRFHRFHLLPRFSSFSRGVRFWLWLDGVVLAIYS
ncbi:MAG: hypothetical protein QE290_18375 [Acidovorax sp.]|uniref:hypothetical protein n=1 Tax=Acidovorax sp. TaxID=1872122 RepID=UPI0026149D59|nr:hypothetical protein [Acidovorax sp.]MDH4466000.1 hypothetical protein [Acidovorax sp.]